ncbi:MAG: peptide ABC transporter substrate-binding protein [Bacteroidetes bacterium]|nr:peptide ABC transporter substrate-binding protein [Bacteroidota bacterium]
MRKKLIYLFVTLPVFFLAGCSGSGDEAENSVEEQSMYGGVFRMPMGSYFSPIRVVEVQKLETAQVYDQVFEGLVKYNPKTLEIEPSLASDWQISPDGLTYTFTLRDEVYFHDNACFEGGKGRKLTSEDVIYTFKTIFTAGPENRAYYTFKNTIAGGDDFYNGKATEISGIKAEGNKVIFTLTEPSTIFLQKMAAVFGVIVPKEAVEAAEFVPVGTGPFIYDQKSTSEVVHLAKNPKYHGKDEQGNPLPYLDSVVFKYYEHSEDAMELFWSGTMSYIPNVPITRISEVLEERISDFESKPPKYILISEPQLSTTYLEFNMTNKTLKNKKVRKAINHAINRQKLVEKIMKNQAYEIGKFGMTPPLPKIFKDYDFEGIEDVSYQYNPELAKQLLAEAGYPDGKGFPTLTFQFRLGNDHYLVASEIQNQLRSVLNINVEIEAIEFNDLIENQGHGRADIFRTTWFGDYPSPETWLLNAYGKIVPSDRSLPSYVNSARFQNAEFDRLFEEGVRAATVEESYKSFAAAEKVLMEEAPFIVLWYGEDMMLVQASVRDLETNGMRYLDLRSVYFKEPTAEEYADKSDKKEQ